MIVSHRQAQTFCQWRGARLPIEAEWERAARGTDDRAFPWGNAAPDCTLANFGDCYGGATSPVGSYPAGKSPFGLYDMAGNAVEMIDELFTPEGYFVQGGSAIHTACLEDGTNFYKPCVQRGGSAASAVEDLKVFRRLHQPSPLGGFRCARDG